MQPVAHSKIKVLLVDDHPDIRTAIRHLLDTCGDIEVVAEAANGLEAIFYVETLGPHVVIMDISMPVMDGITATQRIKTKSPHTMVVGLSVEMRRRNIAAMLQAGATTVIRKEFAWDELHAAIRSSLDSSTTTRLVRGFKAGTTSTTVPDGN